MPLKRWFKKVREAADNTRFDSGARKRDEPYNTANLQLSLRQLAPIERCTTARGTGPAFFFVSCCSTSLFLPFFVSRVKSGLVALAARCHGHVHAIATSESHAHRLSDEFQLSGTHAVRLSQ